MSISVGDVPIDPNFEFKTLSTTFARLSRHEKVWRDSQKFLASRGYMLRPRYHPDWVPSWEKGDGSIESLTHAEDGVSTLNQPALMDATRMSDGRLVKIKRVDSDGEELKMFLALLEESCDTDPDNHCVPLLDHFPDADEPMWSYLVMPFLREMSSPPFETVNDVVTFVDQVLEGLKYMHSRGLAHRNCTVKHIMMDAPGMYSRGFHPIHTNYLPDYSAPAPRRSRAEVPVRYYFVDFSQAAKVPAGSSTASVIGMYHMHPEVPEMSWFTEYDAFLVDIFILGHTINREIRLKYSNTAFLRPLLTEMTNPSPEYRANLQRVLKIWQVLRSRLTWRQRAWRLHRTEETHRMSMSLDAQWLLNILMLYCWLFVSQCARYIASPFRRYL